VLALLALVACKDPPPPVTPIAGSDAPLKVEPTCTDASIGLERGTKDLRDPDTTITQQIRELCLAAPWRREAIKCFATMKTDDLGRCAKELDDKQRKGVLEVLRGTDAASLAIALVELQELKTNVPECDSFVATVAVVLGCDAMPLAERVELGTETASFWELPTQNLRPDMQARISASCKQSLDGLIAKAKGLGCL